MVKSCKDEFEGIPLWDIPSIIMKKKIARKWTKQEDDQLLELVAAEGNNWNNFVGYFNNCSKRQIESRYKIIISKQNRSNNFKVEWSKFEDEMIKSLVLQYGTKWNLMSNIISTRTPDSIRHRYQKIKDSSINLENFTI